MKDLKECAIEIAREAGIFLKDKLNSVHTIDYKGEINLVTEVDISGWSDGAYYENCTVTDY